VSCETQVIQGCWRSSGTAYRDELMRAWVDAGPTPEVRAFVVAFKDRAKARFQQLDIWLTSHSMEAV